MKSAVSISAIVLSAIAVATVVALIIVAPWESNGPDAPWEFDGTQFKDGQVIDYVKDYLRDTKRVAYETSICCDVAPEPRIILSLTIDFQTNPVGIGDFRKGNIKLQTGTMAHCTR